MVCFTSTMFDKKQFILEKLGTKKTLKKKKLLDWKLILFIILAVVGLLAIASGLYFLVSISNEMAFIKTASIKISSEVAPNASSSTQLASASQIYVDLAGAIKNPGLYSLDSGSRLATVIKKAGGFSDQADQEYVAKELNLAEKLQDGDKIYIISKREKEYEQTAQEFCGQFFAQLDSNQSQLDSQQLVSINQASIEDLQSLDGIGEKRAEDIVENRPYQQISDLISNQVLTETIFNNIQNQLKL